MSKHSKFSTMNAIQFDKCARKYGVSRSYWKDLRRCLKHMRECDSKISLNFWYLEAEKNICTLKGFFMGADVMDAFRYTLDLDMYVFYLKGRYHDMLTK